MLLLLLLFLIFLKDNTTVVIYSLFEGVRAHIIIIVCCFLNECRCYEVEHHSAQWHSTHLFLSVNFMWLMTAHSCVPLNIFILCFSFISSQNTGYFYVENIECDEKENFKFMCAWNIETNNAQHVFGFVSFSCSFPFWYT